MHPSLALVLLFALATQAAVPKKNYEKPVFVKDAPRGLSPRIIGGEHAASGEIPYQIGLSASAGWFCGGSLISSEWVLTAAHCGDGAGSVTIYLGSLQVMSGTQRPSSRIHVHSNWDPITIANDVCLIQIESVPLGSTINTVSLTSPGIGDLAGVAVRASGWGLESNNGGSVAKQLNKVDLFVISNIECRSYFGSLIIDSTLCCGGDRIHATCSGDSGGPLVGISSGEQVGVTSFVASSGCAGSTPLGFARISSFRNWIFQISGV